MQAILNSVFSSLPAYRQEETNLPVAPSPTVVAVLLGAVLLVAGAPDAENAFPTEISPMIESRGDLALNEVVARIRQQLPASEQAKAERLGRLVLELAERHQFSPALILAVIEKESSFRFEAVSRAGAVGLMQLLPPTASEVAQRYRVRNYRGPADLRDPYINMRLGVAYLAELRRQFGNSVHYLAAYNLGPAALKKRLRSGNYELGSVDRYVRGIHERAKFLRANSTMSTYPELRRERALAAAAI